MAKSKRRIIQSSKKQARRSKNYLAGGGKSNYARKRDWLRKNGRWGFEVPEPKPWKKKRTGEKR